MKMEKFRNNMLLNCEYCREGIFIKKRIIRGFIHELGVVSDRTLRIHKKCAKQKLEFEIKHNSGEIAHCIDCDKDFYQINKMSEDCPVKGMTKNHRIKGEENLIQI